MELTNIDKLPRRFMVIDPRKVNAYRSENKDRIKEQIREDGTGNGIVEG